MGQEQQTGAPPAPAHSLISVVGTTVGRWGFRLGQALNALAPKHGEPLPSHDHKSVHRTPSAAERGMLMQVLKAAEHHAGPGQMVGWDDVRAGVDQVAAQVATAVVKEAQRDPKGFARGIETEAHLQNHTVTAADFDAVQNSLAAASGKYAAHLVGVEKATKLFRPGGGP